MGIINNAKEIAEMVKKYNDQDLYERIIALREEILELREQNIQLKEQVKALEEEENIGENLVRDGNAYYCKDDENHESPFCLTCWDHDRNL